MTINKKLFKKDYFIAWKIRKKLVELYKRCYKYCIDNNIQHNFDQYGYIKKENRYITVDELEPHFSMIVSNVNKLIAEIREFKDSMYDFDFAKNHIYYNPNLMDAKFPHVHWAYYCVKHGYDKVKRKEYYEKQIIKASEYDYDRYINVEFPKTYHVKWTNLNFLIKKTEELLKSYGETDLIGETNKKKIVFFTGSGISKESGIPTFRDNDGLWEQYPVDKVASLEGYYKDSSFVNEFYNKLRYKYVGETITPNNAHKNIVRLATNKDFIKLGKDKDDNIIFDDHEYEVVVITQNVDNLHEQAITEVCNENNITEDKTDIKVIHLHGELMTMCSEYDKENKKYHLQLPYEGSLEIPVNAKVRNYFKPTNENDPDWLLNQDKHMRPYVVFFGEDVPNMIPAINEVETCDIFVIIGTSLQVYPAANLIQYVPYGASIIYIDPNPSPTEYNNIQVINKSATTGMYELINNWKKYVK